MAANEIGSLYIGLGLDTAVFDRQIVQIPKLVDNAANKIKTGFQGASGHLENFDKSAARTRYAVQQLSFQLNDIGTSLASGGSPLRVLAQQGGQILQIFQTTPGGVGGVLRAAGSSLAGMVTPARAAAGGLAAVAVGVGVLTARALEGQDAIRGFTVLLKGLNLEGQATAEGMEAAAKRLRNVGLSADEAREAMTAATRAGISPGQSERVVRLGQNLIPALGPTAPTQTVGAITGGVDSLGKLVTQLGLVSAAEVTAAKYAEQFGLQLSYIDRWVNLLETHANGLHRQALSPLGQAMEDLRIEAAKLFDAMAKSPVITAIVKALEGMARALRSIFELSPPDWWKRLFGDKVVASAAIPALPGAGAGGGGGNMDALVAAVIHHESRGNPNATSPAGAMGLMQLMPGTARQYGVANAYDPTENVRGGTAYLQDLLTKYGGNVEHALMAYNWGPGNLDKALKGMKEIPSGVRAYASSVMATAGGGGGSVLARPDQARDEYIARTNLETAQILLDTSDQIKAANALAGFTGEGRQAGALGAANVEAALEARKRFPLDAPMARAFSEQRAPQFLQLRQAQGRLALAQGAQEDRNTTEQLQLQADLFGQSTREIDKQVALLKIRQQAETAGLSVTDETVKKREEESNKLADVNKLLAQQQTIMAQVKEVAGVFENSFSQAFDSIAAGTFKAKEALGSLLKDLAKMMASQAFKSLIGGNSGDSGGGILGTIAGKLFGLGGGGGEGDYSGGGELPAFAGGGGFRVGGSGAIDSQLVAFRASPGELVNVTAPGQTYGGSGGAGEIIRIDLNPSEGWVAGVADQRIFTRSGAIVDVAVRQSQKVVARNFAGMSAEANQRQM